VTTTIQSAQLEAITRCELASIALDKAHRALQHPDLEFGGGALLAPSGRKHVEHSERTLCAIRALLSSVLCSPLAETEAAATRTAPPDTAPAPNAPSLSEAGNRVVTSVTNDLACDLHDALERARQHLDLLPELREDAELKHRILDSALRDSSRLGRRIHRVLQDESPGSATNSH